MKTFFSVTLLAAIMVGCQKSDFIGKPIVSKSNIKTGFCDEEDMPITKKPAIDSTAIRWEIQERQRKEDSLQVIQKKKVPINRSIKGKPKNEIQEIKKEKPKEVGKTPVVPINKPNISPSNSVPSKEKPKEDRVKKEKEIQEKKSLKTSEKTGENSKKIKNLKDDNTNQTVHRAE